MSFSFNVKVAVIMQRLWRVEIMQSWLCDYAELRLCRVGSNALQFLVGKLSKVVTAGASWQSSQQ